MANKSLFARALARLLPAADTVNREAAPAYAYAPKAKLAQLAVTGTLSDSFYASAEQHLQEALDAARAVEPRFVAQAAIHARQSGAMKDMPALLTAYLTLADPALAVRVFDRVIDNGRMLRSFVQIMRSGQVGRASLGTRPKRLVQGWLERASMRDLMAAATGNDPSLVDILRLVHPKPADAARRAFYGWLLGKPYDLAALPAEIAAFEAWKRMPEGELPPVPFEWLTAYPLSAVQWAVLAERMGVQALRMNLNTLARNGAFALPDVSKAVAQRLGDPAVVARARLQPYQVQMTLAALDHAVPPLVRAALEQALEAALANVPDLPRYVVICPDVSGSMTSPITGYRKGATSKLRCIDIAALLTAALLRRSQAARVLPFEHGVVPVWLDPADRVAVNAAKLAAIGGGGTNVSAPLAWLNTRRVKVDLVVIVSDNQSWLDANAGGATETMRQWDSLARRNPGARLVCIDIQPHGTTQAAGRPDIINIGGFSDAVFGLLGNLAAGAATDWVSLVEQVEL